MSEAWSVPGYELQVLLGCGATGEVWRARQSATGAAVAVRRLRPGLDAAAVAAVRRAAALLAELDTPYVVRLREVVDTADGPVLVTDHVGGGSLATLLARRGALDAGEVVTVGGPLAQALAAAHAAGLSHGAVTAADVLLTADGMPQLSDLGLRRLVDGAGTAVGPDPAADVQSLGRLCFRMLAGAPPDGRGRAALGAALGAGAPPDGPGPAALGAGAGAGAGAPLAVLVPTAPPALVAAVEAALVPDPADRPDAAAFADLLRRACAAAPVQLGREGAGFPAPRGRHTSRHPEASGRRGSAATGPLVRRPDRQLVLLGGVLVLLVAAAGTVGWLSGRSAAGPGALPPLPSVPPPASHVPSAATTTADPARDWTSVLERLDGARARAFADGDVGALSDVYAPGSPGHAFDAALVAALADRQRTATGVRHSVRSVEVQATTADSVRLRVVDVLAGYVVRGPAGEVVRRAPDRGPAPFLVELVRVDGDWRLVEVRPAP